VSSLPEAGGPWAQKADPNSPEDICDKMVKLLTDTALRQQTIEEALKYAAETFDPTRLARQLMNVYEKIKQ
jgi:glycosyltransferase involved in cell wall biosynthesis